MKSCIRPWHFIKSFCLSFSLYKYKFAVLFKTNTVYYLPNKCLRITISIFFPFALPIIYSSHAFGKENTEKLLSRTRAYVLPLLNKLIVFIHWEMFHFLLLHLFLITIEHSWSQEIRQMPNDFFVTSTCSHVYYCIS